MIQLRLILSAKRARDNFIFAFLSSPFKITQILNYPVVFPNFFVSNFELKLIFEMIKIIFLGKKLLSSPVGFGGNITFLFL